MRFLPGTSTDSTISHGPFFADRRTQSQGRCANLKKFFWNPEQKTVCNRTGRNWLILFLVYAVFMGILIGLFMLTLNLTMFSIKKYYSNSPQIRRANIIKGAAPGLSALPNVIEDLALNLIWYPTSDTTATTYSDYLSKYFEVYKAAENNSKFVKCTETQPKPSDKLCLFDTNSMGPCGKSDYGFNEKQPCFYLKLNKFLDWAPEYYGKNDLPKEMPEELQKDILSNTGSLQYIWVHCQGKAPHDDQHTGNISYYPRRAFFGEFYPYKGDKDFLPPLVAVQVDKLDSKYLLSIRCSVWAKNMAQKGPIGRKAGTQISFYLDP